MKNDLGTMIDALQTPKLHLDLKKLPPGATDREVIAQEYAKGIAEDEFKGKMARVVVDCEFDGLFKHVDVNMRGVNGNVFMILGVVKRALQKAKATPFQISVFMHRAKSGDYDHALSTCSKWVNIVDRAVRLNSAISAFKNLPKED